MPAELPTKPNLSSEVDDLKRQVARLLRLLGQIDASGPTLSISQFCARNNISRSFFYKLKKCQKAPRTMSVGGRQIISPEAERDWRLEREREGAEATVRLIPPTLQNADLKEELTFPPHRFHARKEPSR
jgi:predicted DNA-binding transcriptional regulator AlpA